MSLGQQRRRAVSTLLLLLAGFMICMIGYLVLSSGLVDGILTSQDRRGMLNRIEIASGSNPPDVESLTNLLNEGDWLVAAVAAERIGQLQQAGKIQSGQIDVVVHSLFKALASGGPWWRFGWDREEPEFGQFRGAAIEAAAKFGSAALPRLLSATDSNSPFEREAACWITLSMIENDLVDPTTLRVQGILERIKRLAQSDSNEGVQAACIAVDN